MAKKWPIGTSNNSNKYGGMEVFLQQSFLDWSPKQAIVCEDINQYLEVCVALH